MEMFIVHNDNLIVFDNGRMMTSYYQAGGSNSPNRGGSRGVYGSKLVGGAVPGPNETVLRGAGKQGTQEEKMLRSLGSIPFPE